METLAPSSTPRVGDSAIEKFEVKFTLFLKSLFSGWLDDQLAYDEAENGWKVGQLGHLQLSAATSK